MSQEFFGFIAGLLIAIAVLPQLWRLFRLRSAYEISLPFTLLTILGLCSWLVYGVSLNLPPVIFWNAIMLVLWGIVLYAKLKYGRLK